jgi:hypothetical protein
MANPTSNFNWQMPTPTDLVTDLPADFEVFGQAVDSSMADLLGGTTGQVLAKNSNTDMDFVWVAQDDSNAIQNAIVDAKGDLIAASANDTPARLAVGNNGETLVADSSTPTGLKWAALPASGMTNPMTTTGDTIYSSSGSTPARLAIGTSGQILTVAGGVPTWATPAGGGGKVLQVVQGTTTTQTTSSSATYADTTLTATITPTLSTSKVLIFVTQNGVGKDNNVGLNLKLLRGGTDLALIGNFIGNTSTTTSNRIGSASINYLDAPATTSATTYKTQLASPSGATSYVQNSSSVSTITLMEIGA